MRLRGTAIAAILAGAVCGALLLKASLALAIGAAAAIVLGLVLSTGGLGRRPTSAGAPLRRVVATAVNR